MTLGEGEGHRGAGSWSQEQRQAWLRRKSRVAGDRKTEGLGRKAAAGGRGSLPSLSVIRQSPIPKVSLR